MAVKLGAFARFDKNDDYLRFLKQYGVEEVIISGALSYQPADPRDVKAGGHTAGIRWQFLDYVQARKRCEDLGLRVAAIECGGQSASFAMERIWLGLPGRDEQIENIAYNIRIAGRAGISTIGYHWMPNPPGMRPASWRTSYTTPGRGGALVSAFDGEIAQKAPLSRDREYGEDEMWANYEYFVKAIMPVCAEAGVKLALHPDDPPVERLGGIPRLFHDVAGFQRAMEIADSPFSGLNFCLGNWTAMGTDLTAAIRHFGSRGQILYGHAQGVRGTVPNFTECFLDEADCDFLAVIRALNEVGFDGCLAPAHFPHTVGDTDLAHHATAHALGYLKGLMRAAER